MMRRKFSQRSCPVGSLPIRTFAQISQADAALTRMIVSLSDSRFRAVVESFASPANHQASCKFFRLRHVAIHYRQVLLQAIWDFSRSLAVFRAGSAPYEALFLAHSAAHIARMANPRDQRNKPKKSKDPARPTRAKAAREALPPLRQSWRTSSIRRSTAARPASDRRPVCPPYPTLRRKQVREGWRQRGRAGRRRVCSRRLTIRATAAPILPPRIAPAPPPLGGSANGPRPAMWGNPLSMARRRPSDRARSIRISRGRLGSLMTRTKRPQGLPQQAFPQRI